MAMRSRLVALLLVVALFPAKVLAWPSALPGPNLAAHDFRNGGAAVTAVSVIGLVENGNIYVAGAFDSVDGHSAPGGVARLFADGTLDTSWGPSTPYAFGIPRLAAEGASGDVALA